MSDNPFRSLSPDPFRYPNLQLGSLNGGVHGSNLAGTGGGSSDPLETFLGVFPCARLRGLPFQATLEDVLVFFQGFVILDVVLVGTCQNNDGVVSGEAFVVFANPLDFQMALQRDRLHMGRRYIEVFQGKRADYYAAIASQYWQNKTETESSGTGGDKVEQEKTQPTTTNVWATSGPTPAPTLTSQKKLENVDKGASNRNKGPSSGSGRGNRGQGMQGGLHKGSRGSGGGIQVGEHTGYLRMRGLPFNSTKAEIAAFFKGYGPIESSIALTYRSDGRATGEGYVAFNSPNDAQHAMSLHRSSMGARYIELFISNKEEHKRAVARSSR